MSKIVRIGVVDDHPLMRDGIVHSLRKSGKFKVVAEGASADEAFALAERFVPDMVLLDVNMPGGGVEAARRILALFPDMKIVMLTVSESFETVSSALDHGTKGYVLKGISSVQLIEILLSINDGDAYITPHLAARLLGRRTKSTSAQSTLPELTARESQILDYVAKGMTNREIARLVDLSEKTVKHHMTSVMHKLRVKNRNEAALTLRNEVKQ